VGSKLIGQSFTKAGYFWPRPSASDYNASASAASQLGPLNFDLADQVQKRAARLKASDPENKAPIPADLLTASGSGIDPHISVAAAHWQARRVAAAQGMDIKKLRKLIDQHTENPQWGMFGPPCVNVLRLNLALDQVTSDK
jgi:K+-transporting ATPase ATPase C chain